MITSNNDKNLSCSFILLLEWRWCELRKCKFKWRYHRRSGNCNLSNCKLTRKNFATWTGREHMASALALQCSTNWATKTHKLGAGQFVEFILSREKEWNIEDDVNCANTNVNEDMIVAVAIAILAIATRPEKISGLQRHLNPWPLRYPFSALPTELWRPNIGTCRGQFTKTFTSVIYKCSYRFQTLKQ